MACEEPMAERREESDRLLMRRALAIDERSIAVHEGLAAAYFLKKDYEKSSFYYGKVIELVPDDQATIDVKKRFDDYLAKVKAKANKTKSATGATTTTTGTGNQTSNATNNTQVAFVLYQGSVSTNWVLTRSTDYDTSGSGINEVDAGDEILVLSGTTNANTAWVQQTPLPITIGTTGIVFIQFAAVQTYTAGTGINTTWSNATITANGALIYNNSYGNAAVAILAFGGDKTSTDGDFTINFPTADASSAIIRLTAS